MLNYSEKVMEQFFHQRDALINKFTTIERVTEDAKPRSQVTCFKAIEAVVVGLHAALVNEGHIKKEEAFPTGTKKVRALKSTARSEPL
ncbi:hypothetical protein [Rhizobium grahamii]|uniref:Uncharacterized protein n=1 Tax=Rhizobium grahamii CCGE 502 TaxID=990285 RepID=S3H3C0_9HYPH|nr:hypothetical protein [Rhizobium grahamii]EPE93667.1 hypothetical protein RGCCGE502_32741 [Rhizobium grahamii CCGE 502]